MNRKLHNTVTALAATTGLLVLSLMAANPVPTTAEPFPSQPQVAKATHAQDAAKRIEARAAGLPARLAEARENGQALSEIVGFAAEAATLATIAAALDEAQAAEAAAPVEPPKPATRGRQSVSMPYFSFAPRG